MNKVYMEQPGPLSMAQKSHLLSFNPAPAPVDFSPPCLPPPSDHHHPAAAPAVPAPQVWTPRKPPSPSAPIAAAAPDMMDIPWHHHPSTTGGLCWPEEHPSDLSAFHAPSLFKSNANDALHRTWSSISEGAVMSQPKSGLEAGNCAINASLVSEDSGGNTTLATDGLNLMKGNSSSFPLSVVSSPRAIPFACKLDASAIDVRDVGFVTLSGYCDDSDSSYKNAPESAALSVFPAVKVELDDSLDGKSVQGHGLSSRGEQKSEAPEVKKEIQLKLGSAPDNLSGGSTVAASGDGTMGLKLGKRTYFEDGAVSTLLGEGSGRMPTSNENSNINSSSSTHAGTSKKQKSSPPAPFPRCQAEGCKADLSGAKDYHRRHKVCECHSKASKVKVANVEQRFCQQCSRFHLLSEFDEGKRSCRRRLAGHNERRRKPQPEPMSLLSSGTFACFGDANHLLNGSVLDYPCFLQHKRALVASSLDTATLACRFGLLAGAPDHSPALKLLPMPKESMSSNFPALELHHFVEGASGGLLGGGGGGLQPRNALLTAGGNALALSNPPGMSSSPPSSANMGLISITEPQHLSEIAVCGRALSLLSSSLGSPSNPCSMSMSLAIPSSSPIQQLLSENHQAARQAFPPLSFDAVNNMNAMAANSPSVNPPSIGGEPAAAVPDCLNMLPTTTSLHKSLQTSSSGRPMLDLMSMESHSHYHYTDFEGLSMFGRQNII